MCGIAGILKAKGEVSWEELKRMSDTLAHRGPDGEGIWVREGIGNVGFSHRRLAILDLSMAGKQPMHYKHKYTITYNGEIYNYIEIKRFLQSIGYEFSTSTDTEVLLALYDHKKESCLEDLDGMFSFAIWDEEQKRLFCARDRFGEKPFHYYYDDEKFVFGSEIKALFSAGLKKVIDKSALQDFLKSGKVERGSATFFTNISKLQAGHFLIFEDGKLSLKKYWDLETRTSAFYNSGKEYGSSFRELLVKSISRRLRSDVPIGSSLSGGLDSSSVVCLVKGIADKNTKQFTFSARFHDPAKDEGKWIDLVVKNAGTQHFEVYPDPETMSVEIKKMLYHHEYPFGSSSIVAQWNVMRLAHNKNIKVMLDGQGADEYLAGYGMYSAHYIWNKYFQFRYKEFFREVAAYKKRHGKYPVLGYKFLLVPFLRCFNICKALTSYYIPLKEKLKKDLSEELGELLAYADRNSMAFSIETRLPFLYHELVSFVLSCPEEQIYSNGISKRILREAIKDVAPREIVERKDKLGYQPPEEDWLLKVYDAKESEKVLKSLGMNLSSHKWRNYITTQFIKTFSDN